MTSYRSLYTMKICKMRHPLPISASCKGVYALYSQSESFYSLLTFLTDYFNFSHIKIEPLMFNVDFIYFI